MRGGLRPASFFHEGLTLKTASVVNDKSSAGLKAPHLSPPLLMKRGFFCSCWKSLN
jgi:hypothetical protein